MKTAQKRNDTITKGGGEGTELVELQKRKVKFIMGKKKKRKEKPTLEGKERSRDPAENASGMEEDTLEKMQWKPKDSERMTDTGTDHGDSTPPDGSLQRTRK